MPQLHWHPHLRASRSLAEDCLDNPVVVDGRGDWKTHHRYHWQSKGNGVSVSFQQLQIYPWHFRGKQWFLFKVPSLPASPLQSVIFSFT